jgi:hypothetical protein
VSLEAPEKTVDLPDKSVSWRIAPSAATEYIDPKNSKKREFTMLTLNGALSTITYDGSAPVDSNYRWTLHPTPAGIRVAAPPVLLVQKPSTVSYWTVSSEGNAMQRMNTHRKGRTWQWIDHGRPGLAHETDGMPSLKDGEAVQNDDGGKLAFARPGACCCVLSRAIVSPPFVPLLLRALRRAARAACSLLTILFFSFSRYFFDSICSPVVMNEMLIYFMMQDGRIAEFARRPHKTAPMGGHSGWKWSIREVPEGANEAESGGLAGRASYCNPKRTAQNSCTSSARKPKRKRGSNDKGSKRSEKAVPK